jgi:PAS domain S-box-containing protein
MGAVVAGLVAALVIGFIAHERRAAEQRELQTAEMLARVLEDHADRTFKAVEIAMAHAIETVRSPGLPDRVRWGRAFAETQQGTASLRSLSLVDAHGRVLASSVPANVGAELDLQRVALPEGGAADRLSGLLVGRDLADARVDAPAAGHGASPRRFVTLTRAASVAPEVPTYLVAVLNLDFFANEDALMLADVTRSAALFDIDGTLLVATAGIEMAPGRRAAAHRFFTDYLPRREHGSFIGGGIDGGQVVTAFRTLRDRPLAVIVQRDHARLQAEVARTAAWVIAAGALALAAMAALLVTAWRSLRGHESVHLALESSREQVVASDGNLRLLVESVHELIFRTDAEGRITFVNGRWQQISGHDTAMPIGRRLSDLCLPASRDGVDRLFRVDADRPVEAATAQIETPRGEVRTLEVSATAIRSAAGTVIAFAGFAVDVSERELARQTLESQLAFTARLLEVSPTPLFVKDALGRFANVNRAWLDLMALPLDAVLGRTSTDLYGAQASFHNATDASLLQSEDRIRYENRLVRPDGEERDTVVAKVRFMNADGSPGGIVGSIVDITEFREAERSTREARDAAEESNRAKSEFIANISHELRTPLQAIIGFSELGAELSPEHPELREMFIDVLAGGQRMLTLVNGLLDVAKLDGTVGSLDLSRCDAVALVADVVKELRPLAAQCELRVELRDPGRPLWSEVEPFRIKQVVRNVLANALRFAPVASRIDIGCRETSGGRIEISVRDHGPGIPPGELEAIFDAFVQSSLTRDGSGGTGLGLTICRKIMGAHGGSITARNAEGGGALFVIELPAPAAGQEAVGGSGRPEPDRDQSVSQRAYTTAPNA